MRFEGKFYKAPFGGGTIAITVICLPIILFSCLISIALIPILGVVITCFLVITLVFSLLPVPSGYYIGGDGITISRLNGEILIPYGEIINIKDKKEISKTLSIGFGNRGLLGWACVAYSGRYGWVRIYSRKLSNMVLIDTLGKKYLIAPEDPESFVRKAKQMISITRTYRDDVYDNDDLDSDSGFVQIVDKNGFAEVIDY